MFRQEKEVNFFYFFRKKMKQILPYYILQCKIVKAVGSVVFALSDSSPAESLWWPLPGGGGDSPALFFN